jgi:hypothetical protein
MVACAALDPRDRPGIVEVAARLREMRTAAWMAAEDVVALSRRRVRTVGVVDGVFSAVVGRQCLRAALLS